MSTPTSPPCPFCAIALANPPCPTGILPPSAPPSAHPPPPLPISTPQTTIPSSTTPKSPYATRPTAHLILSTPHVLAFLDHAPISRGHVLVVVRAHREKLGDLTMEESAGVGMWLGVVSRGVVGVVGGDERGEGDGEGEIDGGKERRTEGKQGEGKGDGDVGDWNVVQNNGARAAQVVPHVHFHIIPRVGDVPEVKARSWTVFGKGQREDLDEDDALVLVGRIREQVGMEVERVRRREGEEGVRRLFGGRDGGSKL